jgi:hypothetical protein
MEVGGTGPPVWRPGTGAAYKALEERRLKFLSKVAEIVLQQRQQELFDKIPRFSQVEEG